MDLTPEELRVLGCLVEKQRTVPDTYPLSLNALRSAANQSTNRDPVVSYGETTVEAALDRLRERGLVRRGVTAGSRVIKYWQLAEEQLGLDGAETALLGVLMLRGPQTPGELKARSERLHRFDGIDAVVATLERLAARDDPLVARLAREPGRKEHRYTHLLGDADNPSPSGGGTDGTWPGGAGADTTGPVAAGAPAWSATREPFADPPVSDSGELAALREEVGALRREMEELRDRLDRLDG